MRLSDRWCRPPSEVLAATDSRELTRLMAWERIKSAARSGVIGGAEGKAAIRAALMGGGKKKGKGTTPAKPRKEPKA